MRELRLGIDIGSEEIKLVTTEPQKRGGKPHIVNAGSFPSRGFRAGRILDEEKFIESFRSAFKRFIASHGEGTDIVSTHLALSGKSLNARRIRPKRKVQSEEIQQSDLDTLEKLAEKHFFERFPNERIVFRTPLQFTLDGEEVEGNPAGMFAEVLEAEYLFVSFLENHYEALVRFVESVLGAELDSITIAPLAEAQASLLYRQKLQGVALVNIGSETTTLSVFQNGLLQSLRVIPVASGHITNDIALAFQLSLEEAEKVKRGGRGDISKRKILPIIEARLEDIAEMILKELKEGRKKKYLPAGIVLTGGGANIDSVDEFFRARLSFPVEKAKLYKENPSKAKKKTPLNPAFTSAYGACFAGGERKKRRWKVKRIPYYIRRFITQMKP